MKVKKCFFVWGTIKKEIKWLPPQSEPICRMGILSMISASIMFLIILLLLIKFFIHLKYDSSRLGHISSHIKLKVVSPRGNSWLWTFLAHALLFLSMTLIERLHSLTEQCWLAVLFLGYLLPSLIYPRQEVFKVKVYMFMREIGLLFGQTGLCLRYVGANYVYFTSKIAALYFVDWQLHKGA